MDNENELEINENELEINENELEINKNVGIPIIDCFWHDFI